MRIGCLPGGEGVDSLVIGAVTAVGLLGVEFGAASDKAAVGSGAHAHQAPVLRQVLGSQLGRGFFHRLALGLGVRHGKARLAGIYDIALVLVCISLGPAAATVRDTGIAGGSLLQREGVCGVLGIDGRQGLRLRFAPCPRSAYELGATEIAKVIDHLVSLVVVQVGTNQAGIVGQHIGRHVQVSRERLTQQGDVLVGVGIGQARAQAILLCALAHFGRCGLVCRLAQFQRHRTAAVADYDFMSLCFGLRYLWGRRHKYRAFLQVAGIRQGHVISLALAGLINPIATLLDHFTHGNAPVPVLVRGLVADNAVELAAVGGDHVTWREVVGHGLGFCLGSLGRDTALAFWLGIGLLGYCFRLAACRDK